jgi:hypothetical protein
VLAILVFSSATAQSNKPEPPTSTKQKIEQVKKLLHEAKPSERKTRWAEPKWQRRTHKYRKQGSRPEAESGEVKEAREALTEPSSGMREAHIVSHVSSLRCEVSNERGHH